ncbi:hypothetical protein [Mariniflexile sp. HMF6888]|uniref:hypothetical protein n=1 Tax=Mariniflexile sp. HMF6888 TaxID=3373086 RepID=UPI0037A6F805
MKYLIVIGCLFLGTNIYSQGLKVVEADSLSEAELENMENIIDKEGWVHIRYEGESNIYNYSNKDYILAVFFSCLDTTQTPKYIIEFTKNYRDGTYGGVDFASSKGGEFAKINFYVDAIDFGDPFYEFDTENFSIFYQALKSGKLLTIAFFNMEYNPETGDDELSLNRSIDFKLGNSEFLDIPVNCNVFSESTAPSEEAITAD